MSTNPKEQLEAKLRAYVGVDVGPPWVCADLVNEAMIRHMCVVVGDRNPVYTDAEAARRSVHGGIVAPPGMIMTWAFPPYIPPWISGESASPEAPEAENREVELHQLLNDHGYTGVVMTNYDLEFNRYLRPGDYVEARISVEAISEEKATPLGLGYFVTMVWRFHDRTGEPLGLLRYRVLKFKPQQQAAGQPAAGGAAPAKPRRMRPPVGYDNAWWWEGIQRGELLIQKCAGCGELHHPPRPMCGRCQSVKWESVRASGEGTVYSFTVLHHPKIPGFEYPLVCAVIELAEGTRLVSNVVGCDPDDVRIGMPVALSIENVDEEMKLPLFRPAR
jgi:uncharacterized OB-fold protein/acyl dehydratase